MELEARGVRGLKRRAIDAEELMHLPILLSELAQHVEKHRAGSDKHRNKLELLSELIDEARYDFLTTGLTEFNVAFRIGVLFGRYVEGFEKDYTEIELAELVNTKKVEDVRQSRLRKAHNARTAMRQQCQKWAEELWRRPPNEELRLGEMCQKVWSKAIDWLASMEKRFADDKQVLQLIAVFKNALPDKPDSLKRWLRPVAPKSASRRGPPKK